MSARTELQFEATAEKGQVSAILVWPDPASHLLVLGHGAGSNMRHATLEAIARCLADVGIATFRYNFPYSERRGGRDSAATCMATVRSAVAAARQAAPDLPLLAGGHSFGGRMTSSAAAEAPLLEVGGLVFFSFPLHPPGQPGTGRADHLGTLNLPLLFLSGTRDEFARLDLLRPVCGALPRATLRLLDTADHGYRTLKARQSREDVFVEMARLVRAWSAGLAPESSRRS